MRRSPLLPLVVALVLCVAFAVPTFARRAITVVQTISNANGGSGDVTVTFSAAPGASNHVVITVMMNSEAATLAIGDTTNAATTLAGPIDHTSSVARFYAFCYQGDGSDTTFIADATPNGIGIRVAAAEISGGSCTEDGTEQTAETNLTSHALTTDLTTTQAGSFVMGMVQSNSAADYSASGSTTSIPADGTDIGGVSLGGYEIAGAAGPYDITFSSAANETSLLGVAAVQAAGGGGGAPVPPRLLLLGVGGQ